MKNRTRGVPVIYEYDSKIVFKVAQEAALELGLEITELASDESYFIAKRGVTAFSWGELVSVYLTAQGQESTTVAISSKRRLSLNITAKDFTDDLHNLIKTKLSSYKNPVTNGLS